MFNLNKKDLKNISLVIVGVAVLIFVGVTRYMDKEQAVTSSRKTLVNLSCVNGSVFWVKDDGTAVQLRTGTHKHAYSISCKEIGME